MGKGGVIDFADEFNDEVDSSGGKNDQANQLADMMLEGQRDKNTFNLYKKQITVRPQARKFFDKEKLKELANSINEETQLQPIVVQQVDDNKFELVSGERRFRAIFDILGSETILAVRKDKYESDVKKRYAQLAENIQREGLLPLEFAEELLLLKKETGATNAEIANKLKKSESIVSKTISLLDDEKTPPKIRKMIADGKLAATAWFNDKENVLAAIESGITSFINAGSDATQDDPKKPGSKKSGKKGAKKMMMVSIPFDTALDMAMIYQNLCKRYKLNTIEMGEQPTKKALMAILHARTPDILEKLVK